MFTVRKQKNKNKCRVWDSVHKLHTITSVYSRVLYKQRAKYGEVGLEQVYTPHSPSMLSVLTWYCQGGKQQTNAVVYWQCWVRKDLAAFPNCTPSRDNEVLSTKRKRGGRGSPLTILPSLHTILIVETCTLYNTNIHLTYVYFVHPTF